MGKKLKPVEIISRALWSGDDLRRYELIVIDRAIEGGIRKISLSQVVKVHKDRVIIRSTTGYSVIPIHRVVGIVKDGEVIWSRESA